MKTASQHSTKKRKKFVLIFTALIFFGSISLGMAQAPSIEWQRTYGGTGPDSAFEINSTTDGGYFIVGDSNTPNNGDVTGNHGFHDFWVVKTDDMGAIQWQKSLGGSDQDYAQSGSQTSDGGYIVAGYSGSNDGDVSGNNGTIDVWVVKLDGSGNIQWQNALEGTDHDYAREVRQTTDGGYIVVGFTYSTNGDVTGNHGDFDYWVIKLDASGNLQWQKALGGTFGDEGDSIQQTADGGYIVAGHSFSSDGDVASGNQGLRDFWVVKLDSSGNIEWENSMGGSATDYARSVIQTGDGGYLIGGETSSNDGDVTGHQGVGDYWVVKLNSSGVMEWQKTLGGSLDDEGNAVKQTNDGGYLVAGRSGSVDGDKTGSQGGPDFWVAKLNPTGNLLWEKSLGGSSNESAESIQLTSDGGFIMTGYAGSSDGDVSGNHGFLDYWVVKLSPNLGISDQNSLANLTLFPNPVQDWLTIASDVSLVSARIFDALGREVKTVQFLDESSNGLDVSSLKAGIYMLEATAFENTKTVKIFIKN